MAKEIRSFMCESNTADDLKKIAMGQPPLNAAGNPYLDFAADAVVAEIKHNEPGLTGLFKNRQGACYRVELNNGIEIIVPADYVMNLVVTEAERVGG